VNTYGHLPLNAPERDAPDDALRSPLDDIYIDYLMSKRRESPEFDFKLIIDTSRYRFAEVAKDIFAMANYGGGYIVVGFKETETGRFDPVGLPPDFHVDQADLQQKFNAYTSEAFAFGYREFDYLIKDESRRFAVIQVPAATIPLTPKYDGIVRLPDGREKSAFHRGVPLIRRGTQSARASPAELEWVKKQAEQAEYRISLVSGNPDRIDEVLYSTMFEVREVPATVFSARLSGEQVPFNAAREAPFVTQTSYLYSFEDPSRGPLRPFIKEKAVERHEVKTWLADKDRRNLILWLLDSCLLWEGRQRGMYEFRKRLYFPLREGEERRRESWPGVTKGASRVVAVMMFASQLGERVGVHPAAEVHFTLIDDKLYLRLSPTYVLTRDGRHVRRGEEEGTVITRLSHDDYNAIFLRNLLFWVSKLGGAQGKFRLAGGTIEVDANPMTARLDTGIRADRPGLAAVKLEMSARQEES